jgi:3-phosphoshikimate 1-carboxyvinyltransferase
VPLDWSSASYPMAFAALNHEVFFPGLVPDKYQADAKLFQILTELQSIKERPEGISVHPILAPKRITLDVSDCLDLVPTLSYLLAHVPGEHTLTGFKNLVHKESDRLQEVLALLKIFERETLLTESHLKIFGSDRRLMEAKKLQFPDDHRMVMAGTLFLRHHGGGEVSPVDAVKKSYPDFFKLFE